MKNYKLKIGTTIWQDQYKIYLSRGAIHKREIAINRATSSPAFIERFEELRSKGEVLIDESDSIYSDFVSLSKMGFIVLEQVNTGKTCVLVSSDEVKQELEGILVQDSEIVLVTDLLPPQALDDLLEDKNKLVINRILSEARKKLRDYDSLYLLANLGETTLLRAMNRLTKLLDLPVTFACYDNENVLLLGVNHGETGCFQCLEQAMQMTFGSQMSRPQQSIPPISRSELLLLSGLLQKAIDKARRDGYAELQGYILHFDLEQFGYSFDSHRIQATCPSCATANQAKFEAQNSRAIRLLEELMAHD